MRSSPFVLLFCALLALACGGTATLSKVDRAGFTIEMVDGDIETDQDYQAEGDYDVSYGLSSQALSWHPIEPDETVQDSVDLLWGGMVAILESDDSLETPPKPAYVAEKVAGQDALTFQIELGIETLISTTWRCPEAGIEVTLNSAGLSSAKDLHERSLKTASCKSTPVVMEGGKGFRFVGDSDRWALDPDSEGDAAQYTRADQEVSISVFSQTSLVDGDKLCQTTLKHSLAQMDTLAIDQSSVKLSDTSDGCMLQFAGVRKSDDEAIEGRLHHEGCAGRGYVTICMSMADEPVSAACAGVVDCAE